MKGRFAIIDVNPFVSRAALVEDGVLLDYAADVVKEGKLLLNDIYLGKVERLVPALDGAFVNVGEKAVFLTSPSEKVKEGGFVIAQIVQEGFGTKEAKAREDIKITDYYLEYYPLRAFSVKADGKAADKRGIIQASEKEGGWLVKETAENCDDETLKAEAARLKEIYEAIVENAAEREPKLLYSFGNKFKRFLAETSATALITNDEETANEYLSTYPTMEITVNDLDEFGHLDEQIRSTFEREVPLPSKANVVIEQTEACAVIDVNSGDCNVGNKTFNALKVNCEAAKEIIKQLSLRNIAGSILVDFITLKSAENKKKVVSVLRESALKYPAAITVYDAFTRLGFVELTRKRERAQESAIDLVPIWKLRADLKALAIIKPKAVRISYPKETEINANWFLGFKFAVELIPADSNDYVIQIL